MKKEENMQKYYITTWLSEKPLAGWWQNSFHHSYNIRKPSLKPAAYTEVIALLKFVAKGICRRYYDNFNFH